MAYHDVPRRNVATYGMAYYGMLRHAVARHDMLNTIGMRPPYGCGRLTGHVLNTFGMGRPMHAVALWGAGFICLAWAALWVRPPYGHVLNMFGMGLSMAAISLWACA